MVFQLTDNAPRLLDTSVLSLFFKRPGQKSGLRSQLYVRDLLDHTLAVSFITKGELYAWTIARKWGSHRVAEMEKDLNDLVLLPWHDSVALHYARIQTQSPKASNDAWIAACAIAYGCVLVTDDSDFDDIAGLQVISHHNEGR